MNYLKEEIFQIRFNLNDLQNFVDSMKSTSSLNEKKQIIESIKDNQFIKDVLFYTYNPYFKYNVTSKNCKKLDHVGSEAISTHTSIFDLLDDLNHRVITGHSAVAAVNAFCNGYKEYTDLIFSILDRNLEIRANDSVINKIIPNLIPTFKVALANKYESKLVDIESGDWRMSRKLDGVRCIVRKEGDVSTNALATCKAYSRQGNEFTTIQLVLDDVMNDFAGQDVVLDGELCLMDEDGNDNFQGLMKELKRKDHQIKNIRYVVFDCLTLDEFDNETGTATLDERLERIAHVDMACNVTMGLLEQEKLTTQEQFDDYQKVSAECGYEGVMLRKNTGYEGKRSNNLLKVKQFHDAEYVVNSCDFKDHRVIREGKEVVMPMLAQVYITHKGNEVAVGSGFNQEERIKYQANPEELIGKTITVQYFEETKNQNGGLSLRFPTVKHIYQNGRQH